MTIRVEKRQQFAIVDSRAVNDARISMRARGVLMWLLDKPDDWRVSADAIARATTEGRDAIRTALKELETHGYLRRERVRDDDGRWTTESVVSELGHETVPPPETADSPERDSSRRETSAREPDAGVTDAGESGALTRTMSQEDESVETNGPATASPTAARTPAQALERLPKSVDPETVRALCRQLHNRCRDHHPQHRAPTVSVQWVKDMGTLLNSGPCDVDDFTPTGDQVRAMIDATFDRLAERTGARGFCWADQVNSPGALRRHWVKIEVELAQTAGQGRSSAEVADAVAKLRGMLDG